MAIVKFKFEIGDKAQLESGITGSVRGLHVDKGGVKSALVHYIDDQKTVHDTWVEEGDLSDAE